MRFTGLTYALLAKADPGKQEAFRQPFRELQIQLVLGLVNRLVSRMNRCFPTPKP